MSDQYFFTLINICDFIWIFFNWNSCLEFCKPLGYFTNLCIIDYFFFLGHDIFLFKLYSDEMMDGIPINLIIDLIFDYSNLDIICNIEYKNPYLSIIYVYLFYESIYISLYNIYLLLNLNISYFIEFYLVDIFLYNFSDCVTTSVFGIEYRLYDFYYIFFCFFCFFIYINLLLIKIIFCFFWIFLFFKLPFLKKIINFFLIDIKNNYYEIYLYENFYYFYNIFEESCFSLTFFECKKIDIEFLFIIYLLFCLNFIFIIIFKYY